MPTLNSAGVSSHTASMFYSPVFCAADASTPARSESENSIAREEEVNRENQKQSSESRMSHPERVKGSLRQHLLREQVTAEGDTAAEGNGGEIGALSALTVGPSLKRGSGQGNGGANKA